MLTSDEIHRAIVKMPNLPVAVVQVLELLGRDEFEMDQVQKAIETDPVITSRILCVANSPFYGMTGKVGSLSEAFLILGSHTVRNIVVTTGIKTVFQSRRSVDLDLDELWKHTVGTAVSAKIIAGSTGYKPEAAMIAGLLHEIGKMFLATCFTDEYTKVVQYRDREDCLLSEAEQMVLGVDHGVAGGLLLEHWRLPKELTESIGVYLHPGQSHKNPLTDILHIADIVCRGLEIGNPGDNLIPQLEPLSMQRLEMDLRQIEESLADIEENVLTSLSIMA